MFDLFAKRLSADEAHKVAQRIYSWYLDTNPSDRLIINNAESIFEWGLNLRAGGYGEDLREYKVTDHEGKAIMRQARYWHTKHDDEAREKAAEAFIERQEKAAKETLEQPEAEAKGVYHSTYDEAPMVNRRIDWDSIRRTEDFFSDTPFLDNVTWKGRG